MMPDVSKNKINRIVSNFLFLWCVLVSGGHMLLASFQYIIDYSSYTSILRWVGLCLLIVVFIGIFISLIISSESRAQVKVLLRRMLSFEQILLVFLLGWFALSIYANGKQVNYRYLHSLFAYEDWYLFDLAVCCLILFTVPRVFGRKKAIKFIEILIHITVIVYTVYTIVCLWHIINLEVIDFPSGEQGGITAGYQLMLGKHYNLTGMIATAMFCMCIYMVVTGDKWLKVIYLVFGLVQLFVIYLSNSRTVFVGVLIFAAVGGFAIPWQHFNLLRPWKRLVYCICISLVSIIVIWTGRTIAFILFESVTHYQDVIAAEVGEMTSRTIIQSPVTLGLTPSHKAYTYLLASNVTGEIRQLDSLNNRGFIWRAAVRTLGHDAFTTFFGVTPVGVTDALIKIGLHTSEVAHAHNSVLQVGVSMGIPAMCLLVAFLLSIVCRCIHIIFKRSSLGAGSVIVASSVLCFIAVNMAESYLIAYFSIIACTFFLFAGFITAIEDDYVGKTNFPIKFRRVAPLLVSGISVSLCLLLTLYSSNYLNVNSRRITGSGTFRDPYLIDDASDLKYFRDLVNHDNTFNGKFFTQTNNIDLEWEEWTPIGVYGTQKRFEGVYNGKYHSINNLKISQATGLFDNLKGTVFGLRIENAIINGEPVEFKPENSPNLLKGTNNGLVNFQLIDQGYNATMEADGEGVKVTSTTRDGDNKWLVLFYNDENSKNILAGPAGEKYTISFEAKANVEDAVIRVSHKLSNAKENQITFGTATLEKADEWIQVVLTGTLEGVEATIQGVYLDLRDNPAGTMISLRNLKLEKGDSFSPWTPAVTDAVSFRGNVTG